MSTNGFSINEDSEMTECDGDKVVTMVDVLEEQQDFEEDANAVLGASDDKNCTYPQGYIKRQALYACLTCCTEAKDDPTKRAGVCLACSLTCHENHELIELYTKRNFRCDCGNPKFNSHSCHFTPNKTDLNDDNIYNQNFSGLYCVCHRPYPDPEATEDDIMIQCIICEDWLHASHLEAIVPPNDQYAEMICKLCMEKNEFLHDYTSLAVNVENFDVDVVTLNSNTSEKDKTTSISENTFNIVKDTTNTDVEIAEDNMANNSKGFDNIEMRKPNEDSFFENEKEINDTNTDMTKDNIENSDENQKDIVISRSVVAEADENSFDEKENFIKNAVTEITEANIKNIHEEQNCFDDTLETISEADKNIDTTTTLRDEITKNEEQTVQIATTDVQDCPEQMMDNELNNTTAQESNDKKCENINSHDAQPSETETSSGDIAVSAKLERDMIKESLENNPEIMKTAENDKIYPETEKHDTHENKIEQNIADQISETDMEIGDDSTTKNKIDTPEENKKEELEHVFEDHSIIHEQEDILKLDDITKSTESMEDKQLLEDLSVLTSDKPELVIPEVKDSTLDNNLKISVEETSNDKHTDRIEKSKEFSNNISQHTTENIECSEIQEQEDKLKLDDISNSTENMEDKQLLEDLNVLTSDKPELIMPEVKDSTLDNNLKINVEETSKDDKDTDHIEKSKEFSDNISQHATENMECSEIQELTGNKNIEVTDNNDITNKESIDKTDEVMSAIDEILKSPPDIIKSSNLTDNFSDKEINVGTASSNTEDVEMSDPKEPNDENNLIEEAAKFSSVSEVMVNNEKQIDEIEDKSVPSTNNKIASDTFDIKDSHPDESNVEMNDIPLDINIITKTESNKTVETNENSVKENEIESHILTECTNKRKRNTELEDKTTKKIKFNEIKACIRPKGVKRVYKGATFWTTNFRQKLCTCGECISMYRDLNVLFLTDLDDTVTAYERLGKENIVVSQYEKGLEALSSLDRIQQINALTEYNKMRDKLLDFLKSFKDKDEIVKEEDIKAFFAGMKPRREPDGVYFCR